MGWQAHFIIWCAINRRLDPCSAEKGWEIIVAAYVKCVMTGVNYNNRSVFRSMTCQGYTVAVGHLLALRDFPDPTKNDYKENMISTNIYDLEHEVRILLLSKAL